MTANKTFPNSLAFVLITGWISACGAADGSDGTAQPQYYEKTCVQSSCDSCRESNSKLCSECYDLCGQPFAPADCFSTCRSVCRDSCSSTCSSDDCAEWSTALVLPERDAVLFTQCMSYIGHCSSVTNAAPACDAISRTRTGALGQVAECVVAHQCVEDASCDRIPLEPGHLGSALCDRAQQCGSPCASSAATTIDLEEDSWRSEIKDGLRHCIAEQSCSDFKQCANAYGALLYPSWKKLW